MSDLNLDALTAVAEAATPGPWHQEFYRDGELLPDGTGGMDDYETPGRGVYVIDETSAEGYCLAEHIAGTSRDAAHIAAFDPPTALALLAEAREAERLRREVAALADDLAKGPSVFETLAADTSFRVRNVIANRLRALIGGER